jgi:alpha/beta superfamily hydrolase
LKTQRVTFLSGDTSIELEGKLHLPQGSGPFAASVIAHPYPPMGGSMDVPLVQAIATGLAQANIAALRFNFRIGYSFGAAMALRHATHSHRYRAAVLIGFPFVLDKPRPPATAHAWLLVAGERDEFCPLDDLQALANNLKGDVKTQVIPNADHFLFGHETEVAQAVVTFLHEAL